MISLIGYLIEVRLLCWFAFLSLPLAALANDTLATLGAGGLVPMKSSQIVMEREDLEISIHQITVHYLFRNNGDKDIDTTVAFPLPELVGGTVEHVPLQLPSKTKVNFVDFAVFVAGKAVDVKMEVRAIHEGLDVTERLRAAGLPVSITDTRFAASVSRLSQQQRKQLEKEELVVSDDPSAAKPEYWANWTTKVQFYWTQRFPAHGAVEVRHQYRPVVGGAFVTASDNGASRIKPYCGDAGTLGRIQAIKKKYPPKNEISLFEREIQYILTTANNWSGPIRDFHLSVIADGADDIVLTCTPGLKRVGPTRYELAHTNFHPDRDLDLMILQRP